MSFSSLVNSIKTWVASFFSKDHRAAVVSLLDRAAVFVDFALPIVERIDKELKPAIKTGHEPMIIVVERFIGEGLEGTELTAARKRANDLVQLPKADMLVNIALILLARSASGNVATHLLRLAIELSYSIYKATKDETKVSGSN